MSALIFKALRSPGTMRPITQTASSQFSSTTNSPDPPNLHKPRLLDRYLDAIVRASGATPVFVTIQLGLWAWAFAGIGLAHDYLWPVLISDVQAILSYAFDSLLMRQQFNGYYESLGVVAGLRSRGESVRKMLRVLVREGKEGLVERAVSVSTVGRGRTMAVDEKLPEPSRWTKVINFLAGVIGHVGFVVFYWASIFLWLGFGPSNHWSNQWQLNINSATSALMIFVFSFLAILRERHTDHVRTCLAAIHRVDSLLELKLRTLTSDHMPNSPVEIPPLRMNRIQRAITYYADIVGALTGVALLILVIIAWLAIGPVLKFDTNWWLLIGTYAGLVGLIDGFVLRNIQHKLQAHEDPQYTELADEDDRLFAMWAIPINNAENDNDDGKVSHRLSRAMGTICGHEIMVLAGLFLVLGLLTGASVMRWSETGQLLCNIPPSVVESFFMIILITGHNAGEAKRRVQLERLFERRLRLIEFVDAVGEETMQGGGVVGVEVEVLEK